MHKTNQINNTFTYKAQKAENVLTDFIEKIWNSTLFNTHTFKLRKVIPKDNYLVKELIQKILLERGGVGIDSLRYDHELLSIADYYQLPGHRFNVLIHKKEIVGTVGIGPSIHPQFDPKVTCEVKKLYVHRDSRNKGQGKKMFTESLSQASKMGYDQCIVKIEKREEQFHYFLLKEGFEQLIEKDDDNFSFDLIMYKKIR